MSARPAARAAGLCRLFSVGCLTLSRICKPLPGPVVMAHEGGLATAKGFCCRATACAPALFRGLTAAASLKLSVAAVGHAIKSAILFRGLTAAASLKPVAARYSLGSLLPLPRPHRRGLIEARPAWWRSARPSAPLPRPHRRGLIEACWPAGRCRTPPVHLFRGLTAAASLKRQISFSGDEITPGSSAASPPRPH